jgi:hypothetical protein
LPLAPGRPGECRWRAVRQQTNLVRAALSAPIAHRYLLGCSTPSHCAPQSRLPRGWKDGS